MEEKNNNSTTPQDTSILDFGEVDHKQSIIKVIGVGGGGGNAVNHMYREGIHEVSFVVCNLDKQALDDSPVPVHILLGHEGLGAGNVPDVGRQAAEESLDDIKRMLSDGTKMVFITAGMGGGTGTGAAPVIARVSKDMGILTVGIVTIPFKFEGTKKIDQALDGVEEMAKHVDALLVINNERLREIYSDLSLLNGFAKADDTLSVAAKSIAEIITGHGLINLDFNDVRTVLKDGGVAIMSTGYGEGEGRVRKAIDDALNSPLLNDNDVYRSKKILLNIAFSVGKDDDGLRMEEMNEVNNFMSKFSSNFEIKWGVTKDQSLDKKIKVTILATGFGVEDVEPKDRLAERALAKETYDDEEEEVKKGRRTHYYGNSNGDAHPSKRRHHLFIFQSDDLDNEDVILAVENTPSYRRTHRMLEEMKRLSQSVGVSVAEEENEDDVHGKISFV